MRFGAHVAQKEADAAAGRRASAFDLGRILRADPFSKELDQIKAELVATKRQVDSQENEILSLRSAQPPVGRGARPARRKKRFGGRGEKKDNDYWLGRWAEDVGYELKREGYQRNEVDQLMRERVYSLASEPAADAINERYRPFNRGKNVVSASSLRRRSPSTVTVNARGEKINEKGEFMCKRWGQWEVYRKGEEPEDRLADGSNDPTMDWANRREPERIRTDAESHATATESEHKRGSTAAGRLAATALEKPATNEPEDDRKRNLFDGSLVIATIKDDANEAIAQGKLRKHEGGQGVTRVRPPKDDREALQDQQDRAADEFLDKNGLDPDAVHRGRKRRRKTTTKAD